MNTDELVNCFLKNKNKKLKNDQIFTSSDKIEWFYYGSNIAKIDKTNGNLYINLQGFWYKSSTRSRLNRLPGVRLSVKDGVLHNHKKFAPTDEWIEVGCVPICW